MLAATQTIGYREAAATAAAIHMHYEGEVVETPLRSFADDPALDGVAVLAPTQGVVEFFPSEGQPVAPLAQAIETAAAQGWSVGTMTTIGS